jgi:hypothetical protein
MCRGEEASQLLSRLISVAVNAINEVITMQGSKSRGEPRKARESIYYVLFSVV